MLWLIAFISGFAAIDVGADMIEHQGSNPAENIIFCVACVFLALSVFGLYIRGED